MATMSNRGLSFAELTKQHHRLNQSGIHAVSTFYGVPIQSGHESLWREACRWARDHRPGGRDIAECSTEQFCQWSISWSARGISWNGEGIGIGDWVNVDETKIDTPRGYTCV